MMHADHALPDIATATSRSLGAPTYCDGVQVPCTWCSRHRAGHCPDTADGRALPTSDDDDRPSHVARARGARTTIARIMCVVAPPAGTSGYGQSHAFAGWLRCGRGSRARSARPGRGAGSAATRAARVRSRHCADPMAPVRHHGRYRDRAGRAAAHRRSAPCRDPSPHQPRRCRRPPRHAQRVMRGDGAWPDGR
jgi:hypothetical protein